MEVNKGLLAFFAEEEGADGGVVHEEVFGEDGGEAGMAEEVEVFLEGGEAVHDAAGKEAVLGVFQEAAVGAALARRLSAVTVMIGFS